MSGYFKHGDTLDGGAAGSGLNILIPAPGALLGAASVGGTITPQTITLGAGLSLAGTVLNATGSGGTVTEVDTTGPGITGGPITGSGALAVEWNAGTVAAIGNGLIVDVAHNLSISAGGGLAFTTGSLVAQWQGGTVTSLGSGVSLVGGVLSATGTGGSVTSVAVTGAGISSTQSPLTTSGTLSVEWNGGTVAAVGNGLTIDVSNNLSVVAGTGLSFTGGTLNAAWNGGSVSVLGSGISLNLGTLSAGGLITALGTNFTQTSGTLHLAAVPTGDVLGYFGGGSGEPVATTMTNALTNGFQLTTGQLPYGAPGSVWGKLSLGSRGSFLTSVISGGNSVPAWSGTWANTGANTPSLGTNSPSTNLTPVGYLALPDNAGVTRYIPYF